MKTLIRAAVATVGALFTLKMLPILSSIIQVDMSMTFIFVTVFLLIYSVKRDDSL